MQKIFSLIIVIVTLTGILVPTNFAFGASCSSLLTSGACTDEKGRSCVRTVSLVGPGTLVCADAKGEVGTETAGALGWILEPLAKGLGHLLIAVSTAILGIAGFFFDLVMQYTIIDMAKNIGDPNGVGGSISAAWGVLRDISNMIFIFVLLYAAFNAMFSMSVTSFGKTVKDIIIIALLINFSLFFTKIVIDASNIVSTGFYNSIINANNTTQLEGLNDSFTDQKKLNGISAGYMNLLGISDFYRPNVLKATTNGATGIFTVGIMQSIFILVTAVVLLITAFMFVARFIILIFLMVLSPAALIAYIIPSRKGDFDTWIGMLISQAVFAPVFFALTWVVFKIASTKNFLGGDVTGDLSQLTTAPSGAVAMVLNYVLIIGFAIASLIISKSIASKTAGFSTITGGAAAVGLGVSSWGMRNVAGRAGRRIANNKTLKDMAAEGKGVGGLAARSLLWTSDKAASGSYDVRAIDSISKVPGLSGAMGILGKAGGKGGFAKAIDTRAEEKAKYSKRMYGELTEADKAAKEKLKEQIEEQKVAEKDSIRNTQKLELEDANKDYKTKNTDQKTIEDRVLGENNKKVKDLKRQRSDAQKKLAAARAGGDAEEIKKAQSLSDSLSSSIDIAMEELNEKRKDMEENNEEYKNAKEVAIAAKKIADAKKKALNEDIKNSAYSSGLQEMITEAEENAANKRQRAFANRLKTGIFGWTATNAAAAQKIEKQAKDKTTDQKIADLAKQALKDEQEKEKTNETAKTDTENKTSTDDGTKKS